MDTLRIQRLSKRGGAFGIALSIGRGRQSMDTGTARRYAEAILAECAREDAAHETCTKALTAAFKGEA